MSVTFLCTWQDGVRAYDQGATGENNLPNAGRTKDLSIKTVLQNDTGQNLMDVGEEDLLLLPEFQRRLEENLIKSSLKFYFHCEVQMKSVWRIILFLTS